MKPFFKWSGGKTKEIPLVKKHMPDKWNVFYEPFIGGGAVWLALEATKSVIGDTYEEVTNFFQVLKRDPEKLILHLNALAEQYNLEVKACSSKEQQAALGQKYFYDYREAALVDPYERAVRFYLMRQLSFSGMLRFNSTGKFNVPYGWYKSLKALKQDPSSVAELLANTTIMNSTWEETVSNATSEDFVFLDPPYTRKFRKYHPEGSFGKTEHEKLADWFASKQSQALIIVNKDDFTNSLYKPFIKEEYDKRYAIQYRNRMTEEDSNAIHLLATNY